MLWIMCASLNTNIYFCCCIKNSRRFLLLPKREEIRNKWYHFWNINNIKWDCFWKYLFFILWRISNTFNVKSFLMWITKLILRIFHFRTSQCPCDLRSSRKPSSSRGSNCSPHLLINWRIPQTQANLVQGESRWVWGKRVDVNWDGQC